MWRLFWIIGTLLSLFAFFWKPRVAAGLLFFITAAGWRAGVFPWTNSLVAVGLLVFGEIAAVFFVQRTKKPGVSIDPAQLLIGSGAAAAVLSLTFGPLGLLVWQLIVGRNALRDLPEAVPVAAGKGAAGLIRYVVTTLAASFLLAGLW